MPSPPLGGAAGKHCFHVIRPCVHPSVMWLLQYLLYALMYFHQTCQ